MRAPKQPEWNTTLLKALQLPDGAFKLYVWLRLNAGPDTGVVEVSQYDLAAALGKARGTVRSNLTLLVKAGVIRAEFRRAPAARGRIQFTEEYWPYDRIDAESEDPELTKYQHRIQAALAERACVRCAFSAADKLLAREWYERGLTVESIEHAILLGSARKYVSWRNGAPRVPIGSLRYFEPILAELEQIQTPAEYWQYTRYRLKRMEAHWQRGDRDDEVGGSMSGNDRQMVND